MKHFPTKRRQGFTITELMIVISIIGLLAGIGLSAFNAAVAQSKISRTKVIIAKLDQLIMDRWESYRTRPVPIRTLTFIDANNNGTQDSGEQLMDPRTAARNRLNALREIMRLELPCSKEDVHNNPTVSGVTRTAVNRFYIRRAPNASWTDQWEEAECLYLIVASMRDTDKSALDFFTQDEIGDVDGDGVPEILDAWGNPIMFIRWAPGFSGDADTPAISMQRRYAEDGTTFNPDPFDPLKVDTHWSDMDPKNHPIALKPLIYSFGPDKEFTGIQLPDGMGSLYDPYRKISGQYIGAISDVNVVGDNITNHYQEAE
jgi:prepilin-type N-terminal cleavage/methylation domain-containing protein